MSTTPSPQRTQEPLQSAIASHLDVSQLRYSQVWEDHSLLERGLQIEPSDHVLSITSAGDNVLALLLNNPASVTAVDMSPAQSALLGLKIAAIKTLSYDQWVQLLGWRDADKRLALYARLRPQLDDDHVAFWDERLDAIVAGVSFEGRLEQYIRRFQTDILARFCSPRQLDQLFAPQPLAEQARLFHRLHCDELAAAFRVYFGREMMARHGRSEAQFAHVGGIDVGAWFHQRFVETCTRLPLWNNPYMSSFLRGRLDDLDHGPSPLRRDNFERLRQLVERVTVVTGSLEQVLSSEPEARFSKANLSNIFEYMSPESSAQLLNALASHMRPGGRVAYWNLLVARHRPAHLGDRLRRHTSQAHALWTADRSWFYRAFQLEEVLP